jgi:hypothetical protein
MQQDVQQLLGACLRPGPVRQKAAPSASRSAARAAGWPAACGPSVLALTPPLGRAGRCTDRGCGARGFGCGTTQSRPRTRRTRRAGCAASASRPPDAAIVSHPIQRVSPRCGRRAGGEQTCECRRRRRSDRLPQGSGYGTSRSSSGPSLDSPRTPAVAARKRPPVQRGCGLSNPAPSTRRTHLEPTKRSLRQTQPGSGSPGVKRVGRRRGGGKQEVVEHEVEQEAGGGEGGGQGSRGDRLRVR